MKYRVDSKDDLERLEQLLGLSIDNDDVISVGSILKGMNLKDADIQLVDNVAVVTGTFTFKGGFNITTNNSLPITSIRLEDNILNVFIDCSGYATDSIERMVLQLMMEILEE